MTPLGEAKPFRSSEGWRLVEYDNGHPVASIWTYSPSDAVDWRDREVARYMVRRCDWEADACARRAALEREFSRQQAVEFRRIRVRA